MIDVNESPPPILYCIFNVFRSTSPNLDYDKHGDFFLDAPFVWSCASDISDSYKVSRSMDDFFSSIENRTHSTDRFTRLMEEVFTRSSIGKDPSLEEEEFLYINPSELFQEVFQL